MEAECCSGGGLSIFFLLDILRLLGDNKRIAKNTIYLYVRSLFLLLVGLYTTRLVLRLLGQEDYGVFQVVGGVVVMFSMLSATLSSASQRFVSVAMGRGDEMELRRVFATSLWSHVLLGVIVVVVLEVLGVWFLENELNVPAQRLSVARVVLQFSIATFFVGVISVPYNAVIVAHERMGVFALISVLEGVLKLSFVLLLYVLPCDKLLGFSVAQFVVALVLRFVSYLYALRSFPEVRNVPRKVDMGVFSEMFSFAGWNLLGNGSLVLRNQGVDILLNIFFGVVVNAAKGISNQVQGAVMQLVGNFTTALKPQLTMSIARGDYARAFSLINKGSRYCFLLMLVVAVPVIVCAPGLLRLWLVDVPELAVLFVRWTMLYLLLDSLSKMLIHSILSKGDIKWYEIWVGGTKLLAIPLTYCFLLGYEVAIVGVWVNILLEFACLIERLYFNSKLLSFDWRMFLRAVLVPCALALGGSLGMAVWLAQFFAGGRMLFPLLVMTTCVTCVCVWFLGVERGERAYVVDCVRARVLKR